MTDVDNSISGFLIPSTTPVYRTFKAESPPTSLFVTPIVREEGMKVPGKLLVNFSIMVFPDNNYIFRFVLV